MAEFERFNSVWDQKMNEYEIYASDLMRTMQERHSNEITEFLKDLICKQGKPKFSRDLLNLRKIQETLAKQKK